MFEREAGHYQHDLRHSRSPSEFEFQEFVPRQIKEERSSDFFIEDDDEYEYVGDYCQSHEPAVSEASDEPFCGFEEDEIFELEL